MSEQELRNYLQLVMETEPCGLRGLQELTGVGFSTLSRFLRGSKLSLPVYLKLKNFREGILTAPQLPKVTKRFSVGKKTFLVSITEVE